MLYQQCTQCPRNCSVNREQQKGFCLESQELKIASATLHFGEEPLITVNGGSGTIFVTGCNLRCAFCQNYQISQQGMGKTVSIEEFVQICLELQAKGAENINIVTGSHHIPFLAQGLKQAKDNGLSIPICWNSSAYESVDALSLLEGIVDIWLPDLKTLNPLISEAVFKAKNYPSVAKRAIKWMMSHTETAIEEINGKEKMLSGVIIRHLVLPGRLQDTKLVLDWLKDSTEMALKDSSDAFLSIMSQYTPVKFKEEFNLDRHKALESFQNRLLSKQEFSSIQDMIQSYDFSFLFYQELEEDTEWLPDFSEKQPFSYALAKPVWHWKNGFCK